MKPKPDSKLLILGRTPERIAKEKSEMEEWQAAGVGECERRNKRLGQLLAQTIIVRKEVIENMGDELNIKPRGKNRKRT